MAISREGPIVGQISGKIGGVVFNAGRRAGVISTPPTPTPSYSLDLDRRRHALVRAQTYWRDTSDLNRRNWTTFAQKMPWTNRLNIRRPLSGYHAYLAYTLRLDPFQAQQFGLVDPPSVITTATPIISSVAFDHDGACTITTQTPPDSPVFEYLFIRTLRQYGQRTSPGQTRFVIWKSRSGTSLNWASDIATAGITFQAGEVLGLKIFWVKSGTWPSQNQTAITTAT